MRVLGSLLIFVIVSGMPAAYADNFSVRYAEGENVMQRAGQTAWSKLQIGDEIHLGDRMVCSEDGLLQLENPHGVLELTDSADILMRSIAASPSSGGPLILELASGQIKGDWNGGLGHPLLFQVPGGEFRIEDGFFSLWIYSLLGRPYTRVDLFRGEGFLQETSSDFPLGLLAGQHMTTGFQGGSQGPREAPVIPGFDTFEIQPPDKAVALKPALNIEEAALMGQSTLKT